jgi:hypothetical protein
VTLPPSPNNGSPWPRRIVVSALFVTAAILLSFIAWKGLYPEDGDPKNIDYVLWKHGLNARMNLDHAVGGMTHDTWAVNIVKGMSEEQLKTRFGYLRSLGEVTPYLQECYAPDTVGELGVRAQGKRVVFLRDSWWMVILDDGKAVDLVLCKGY